MANKHSMLITSTNPSGKVVSKAIPCVNPDATPTKMRQFATALNALSENTLSQVERVDRVTVAENKFTLPYPSVTITCGSQTWTEADFTKSQSNQTLRIWINSDGVTKADGKYTTTIRFSNGNRISLLADDTEQGRLTVDYRVESTNGMNPDGDGILKLSVPDDFKYTDYESYITVGVVDTFANRGYSIDVYFTDDENDGGFNNG